MGGWVGGCACVCVGGGGCVCVGGEWVGRWVVVRLSMPGNSGRPARPHSPSPPRPSHPPLPQRSGATPRDFRILPRKIVLVRHAESEGNVDNVAYTYLPDPKVPLTARGWQQVGGGAHVCVCVVGGWVGWRASERVSERASECVIQPPTLLDLLAPPPPQTHTHRPWTPGTSCGV